MGDEEDVETWAKDALAVVRTTFPTAHMPHLEMMQDGMILTFASTRTLLQAFKREGFDHTAIGPHEGYITRKGDPCGLAYMPSAEEKDCTAWLFYNADFAF